MVWALAKVRSCIEKLGKKVKDENLQFYLRLLDLRFAWKSYDDMTFHQSLRIKIGEFTNRGYTLKLENSGQEPEDARNYATYRR